MFNEERRAAQPIRWGMVGGGKGSQIGYIHRSSAQRDGRFQLLAGAFDINAQRGKDFGAQIGVDSHRCYKDYKEMFSQEAKREDGIQAVSIATPNFTHYEICKEALRAGLHVVCEKPLCFSSAQAEELIFLAQNQQKIVGVTYGYTGFPMVHQARNMIEKGELGEIRIINMQFAHGFHSQEVESQDPGAKWRVTSEMAGPSYVLGDTGTHILFLAETMVPGLEIESLLCSKQSFVKSRAPLEDNATVLLNFKNNRVGTLWASAVNAGSMHQQKIRVIGSKASVEWWDEYPNQLRYEVQGKPAQILERGMGYLYHSDDAVSSDHIGGGHAEGLFEAWSNLYDRFCRAMIAKDQKDKETLSDLWYPNILDGARGIQFIEKCIQSAEEGSSWVKFS